MNSTNPKSLLVVFAVFVLATAVSTVVLNKLTNQCMRKHAVDEEVLISMVTKEELPVVSLIDPVDMLDTETLNAYESCALAEAIIGAFEGFSATIYPDGTQCSIGYGTSLEYAKAHGFVGTEISDEEALSLLRIRINEEYAYLDRKIANFHTFEPEARAALISTAYNTHALIGPKLTAHLEHERYVDASVELALGHNPKGKFGLVKRRFSEARLLAAGFQIELPIETPSNLDEFEQMKAAR